MRCKITSEEINVLGKYIKEKSGIVLDDTKAYLFESRLGTLLDEAVCDNYLDLLEKVKKDYSGTFSVKLIDAVTTNETSFFRDKAPFQLFIQKIVPDFYERNPTGSMTIWSAASSTGQEIYSLIMMLKDAGICPPKFKMKMLGTDICDVVISRASRGRYSKFELARGMDSAKLNKFFVPLGDEWVIKEEIRAMVQFKRLNLLDPLMLNSLGRFDVIFCRNVAIYFSQDDKKKLFNSLATLLNPYGILVIGATESLLGITDRFVRKDFRGTIFYEKI